MTTPLARLILDGMRLPTRGASFHSFDYNGFEMKLALLETRDGVVAVDVRRLARRRRWQRAHLLFIAVTSPRPARR